jgi:hypothetical protein
VHGGGIADFEAAAAPLRDLRVALPASHLLLTAEDARVCAWLRARYPGHKAVPPPWQLSWSTLRPSTQSRLHSFVSVPEPNVPAGRKLEGTFAVSPRGRPPSRKGDRDAAVGSAADDNYLMMEAVHPP